MEPDDTERLRFRGLIDQVDAALASWYQGCDRQWLDKFADKLRAHHDGIRDFSELELAAVKMLAVAMLAKLRDENTVRDKNV